MDDCEKDDTTTEDQLTPADGIMVKNEAVGKKQSGIAKRLIAAAGLTGAILASPPLAAEAKPPHAQKQTQKPADKLRFEIIRTPMSPEEIAKYKAAYEAREKIRKPIRDYLEQHKEVAPAFKALSIDYLKKLMPLIKKKAGQNFHLPPDWQESINKNGFFEVLRGTIKQYLSLHDLPGNLGNGCLALDDIRNHLDTHKKTHQKNKELGELLMGLHDLLCKIESQGDVM